MTMMNAVEKTKMFAEAVRQTLGLDSSRKILLKKELILRMRKASEHVEVKVETPARPRITEAKPAPVFVKSRDGKWSVAHGVREKTVREALYRGDFEEAKVETPAQPGNHRLMVRPGDGFIYEVFAFRTG